MKVNKRFMIGGWLAPGNSIRDYVLAGECGINTMYLLGGACGYAGDDVQIEAIKLCEEAGIDAIPTLPRNMEGLFNPKLLGFKNIPAVMVYDEPSAKIFPEIIENIEKFNRFFPENVRSEVNLLPSYSSSEMTGTDSYEEYVKRFAEEVMPVMRDNKVMSLDYYPFYSPGGNHLDPSWLKCLTVVTYYAIKNGIRSHCFIQTMPFSESNDVNQDFESLRFQFMTYMAMGFSSFTHFCYASPGIGGEFLAHQQAVVGRDGEPTPLYAHVKRVNEFVQTFAESFLSYDYVGTCPVAESGNDEPEDFKGWKHKLDINDLPCSVKSQFNVLAGKFTKKDGLALFITNFTCLKSGDGEAELDFGAPVKLKIHKDGKITEKMTDGKFSFRLENGNGVFIEIIKQKKDI